jgi:hypothetical protein
MVLPAAIDWTTKYGALYDWVFGATGIATVWADQDEARPDYPYILLDIIATPREGGVSETRKTLDTTRARDVKVTPVAQDSTTYTVNINGTDFPFVSDATATVAEITAGLVAAINAGAEPVSATDNGTDLDIEGDPETLNPTVKGLFNITMTDDFDGDQIAWANNDSGNEVRVEVVGRHGATLNIQAFERNTRTDNPGSDPSRNAYNMLTTLQASLGLPSVQKQIRDDGDLAVIEELPIQDLSEQVEDTLLSRASMDIRMRTTSSLVEYEGYITTVSGTGTLDVPGEPPVVNTYSASTS